MKSISVLTRSLILRAALTVLVSSLVALPVFAQTDSPDSSQKQFDSPDDAVQALRTAVSSDDKSALKQIFGSQMDSLMTGDAVQDANNSKHFAAAMADSCQQVKDDSGNITLEVGTNQWPMPIPLVQANGKWFFDTAAGKQEIIARHIGKDELNAIGICRAYVVAQQKYARLNPEGNSETAYALKFKSSDDSKDGLYWPTPDGAQTSPFGPLVAEAAAQGFGHSEGSGHKPFHGYYFRILTRQGDAAPNGKMNYLHHGKLTGGYALVAYPVNWDQSGIMTFIVNQDGKVYQQNLGEKTAHIAGHLKEYNPDSNWTLVNDPGEADAAMEKVENE